MGNKKVKDILTLILKAWLKQPKELIWWASDVPDEICRQAKKHNIDPKDIIADDGNWQAYVSTWKLSKALVS